MVNQEEFNKIADGMEEVNREMADKIEDAAPICHFRKINLECGEYYEGSCEQWWKCSVCRHLVSI